MKYYVYGMSIYYFVLYEMSIYDFVLYEMSICFATNPGR